MSERLLRSGTANPPSVMISFGERFSRSEQFDRVFKEGMALVERTAAYLEGEGRAEAKKLKAPISLTYTTESMRLTTRLLELASWLLVRRAVNAGELTPEEAAAKRARIKLGGTGRPTHVTNWEALPQTLRALIEESFHLTDRILHLDRALAADVAPGISPVNNQIARIETAFCGKPRLAYRN